ncbi:MAG: C40 family peptidase [Gemmatimonadales bacterium]|nr:C40 family peptidase [Gemmatimonadales bacterium]MDQ3208442.1 C40 family peptidase [Gemmatimonadota bacterium]
MPAAITQAAIAPVLAEPRVRAEQVTQLVLGETATVTDHAGDWRRVCTQFDGYDGWVNAGYLREVEDQVAEDWRSRAEAWSEGATMRIGGVHVSLPLRARVVLDQDSVALPDGRRGRITQGSVRRMSDVTAGARAKAPERWAFEHFMGSPYQWGGVTPWGVDCSGLVQTTFAARGVTLPRDSSQQVIHGDAVSPDSVRPGDLLFFSGEIGSGITHVAFAGDADTLIHSTLACGGTLAEPWLPGTRAAVLRPRLVAVRRLEQR